MQLKPIQKLAMTASAALVVVGMFGAASYYYASRLGLADRAVERANSNIAAALSLIVVRQDGERSTKAYVVRPDTLTRAAVAASQARAEDAVDALTRGTDDNPRQLQHIQQLARGVSESFATFRSAILLRDRAGADSARRILSNDLSAGTADSLMRIVTEIRDEELRVLAERTRLQSMEHASAQRTMLIGMVLTFLLAGVALQPVRAHVAKRLTSRILRGQVAVDVPMLSDEELSARGDEPLRALQRLSADLAGAADARAAALAIVTATAPFNAGAVAVIAASVHDELTVLATSPSDLGDLPPALTSTVRDVLRTGEAVTRTSRDERDRQWGPLPALDTIGAPGGVLIFPVLRAGTNSGVLVIALATDRPVGDDELEFGATLGRLGGLAIADRTLT